MLSDHPIARFQDIVQFFKRDQRFLLLTKENGFFWMDKEKLTTLGNSSADLTQRALPFTRPLDAKNGGFALGSIAKGLVLLNEAGDY